MKSPEALRLDQVFAVLTDQLLVDTVEVSPTVYSELDETYNGFKGHALVAVHEFTQAWGSWEMHPAGDEIVVLLSGDITFRVRGASEEYSVKLSEPGEYLIVPKGRWHTAETGVPSRLLFITPGEGTEHEKDK
jgi:mannose-6-phosphate isomerase-like protein (cupin superfamily)